MALSTTHSSASSTAAGVRATAGEVVFRPGAEEQAPARFRARRRITDQALAWGVTVAFFAAWQLAGSIGLLDQTFFPPPSKIWSTALSLVASGDLQAAMAYSLANTLVGFCGGTACGVLLGGLLGSWRPLRVAFMPLTYALYTVPKLSILPLLLLILGLGAAPEIALIWISTFFLVVIPTTAAFTGVPLSYREAADSFGSSRVQLIRHVLLPAALPQVFVGLRVASGASILVMVGAEFVAGNQGLGYLIWHSWSLFLADRMYVGIVVTAVSGVLFTLLVAAIGRRIAPWAEEH